VSVTVADRVIDVVVDGSQLFTARRHISRLSRSLQALAMARVVCMCPSIITPPPIGERSVVMSVSVCPCVFICPIFIKVFVYVTYGRGSVLLWRRSDKLCTSGFMDDII